MNFPSFENVNELLRTGVPHRLPLCTSPNPIDLLVDPPGLTLAVIVLVSNPLLIDQPRLEERSPEAVTIAWYHAEGLKYLAIAVPDKGLVRYAHGFLAALVDELKQSSEDIEGAIERVIAKWRALLAKQQGLSLAEATGLWGELWFLNELVSHHGVRMLESWLGPQKENHDFRLGAWEIEIKTTLMVERVHTIHGLAQLAPSLGRHLFLLSIHAAVAGAGGKGESLSSLSASLADKCAKEGGLSRLEDKLAGLPITLEELALSEDLYCHRSPPHLIPVDARIPSLTRGGLADTLTQEAMARLRRVDYAIDVYGLGTDLDVAALLERCE